MDALLYLFLPYLQPVQRKSWQPHQIPSVIHAHLHEGQEPIHHSSGIQRPPHFSWLFLLCTLQLRLIFLCQPVETVFLESSERHGLLCRDHATFPSPVAVLPVLRVLHPRPAKVLPACLCHLDALALQLMALRPVLIRHICEYRQHHIRAAPPVPSIGWCPVWAWKSL